MRHNSSSNGNSHFGAAENWLFSSRTFADKAQYFMDMLGNCASAALAGNIETSLAEGKNSRYLAFKAYLLSRLDQSQKTDNVAARAYIACFRKSGEVSYVLAAYEHLKRPLEDAIDELDKAEQQARTLKWKVRLTPLVREVGSGFRRYAELFPQGTLEKIMSKNGHNFRTDNDALKFVYKNEEYMLLSREGAIKYAKNKEAQAATYLEKFRKDVELKLKNTMTIDTVRMARTVAELDDNNPQSNNMAATATFWLYNQTHEFVDILESREYINKALQLADGPKKAGIAAEKDLIEKAYEMCTSKVAKTESLKNISPSLTENMNNSKDTITAAGQDSPKKKPHWSEIRFT